MTTPTSDADVHDRDAADEAGARDGDARDGSIRDGGVRDGAIRDGVRDSLTPIGADARYATTRNILIGVGAFYVSRWMAGVLRVTLTALAHEVMSVDGLRQALLTPFVSSLSHALAAASAGAVVVLLVEARETSARWRWAAVPAVLWFLRSLDEVTISAPGWMHLAMQLVTASLPSIVCLAAGHLADWHRSR